MDFHVLRGYLPLGWARVEIREAMVLAYCAATLREGPRSVWIWVLAAVGVATGWFVGRLSIFSFGEAADRAPALLLSTSGAVGALVGIGLVAQTLEMDASSGFTGAADAAGPGLAGRLLGRWLGATAMGGLLAVLVLSLSWPAAEQGPLPPIWLLSTTIVVIALAAAWTLVLGAFGGGVVGMVAGSLAWLLAFLPMGHPAFFGGAMGRALRAVLPNPPWETAPLSWWGVKLLVLVALLGVAVAGARPVTKRG